MQEDRQFVEKEFERLDETTRQPLARQQLRELWAVAATGGKVPPARYLHAAAVVPLPVREAADGEEVAGAWGEDDEYGVAEEATHVVVVGGV
jgi:hypothetical protein